MSSNDQQPESARSWLTGLVVIVAVIVSYVGFASISIEWTLAVSSVIFVGLILFFWRVGVRKQRSGTKRR